MSHVILHRLRFVTSLIILLPLLLVSQSWAKRKSPAMTSAADSTLAVSAYQTEIQAILKLSDEQAQKCESFFEKIRNSLPKTEKELAVYSESSLRKIIAVTETAPYFSDELVKRLETLVQKNAPHGLTEQDLGNFILMERNLTSCIPGSLPNFIRRSVESLGKLKKSELDAEFLNAAKTLLIRTLDAPLSLMMALFEVHAGEELAELAKNSDAAEKSFARLSKQVFKYRHTMNSRSGAATRTGDIYGYFKARLEAFRSAKWIRQSLKDELNRLDNGTGHARPSPSPSSVPTSTPSPAASSSPTP